MDLDDPDAAIASLRDLAGDSLRVVATYDRDGYDGVYVREDLESRMAAQADEIHGELVLAGIGRGHLEDLFGAGDLHCSMHRFDEMTAFHFVGAEYAGLFVSLDADADVPLATFADRCKSLL